MKAIDQILNNEKEVLTYLKSKYHMYHLSNIFFRDIQYGIQAYLYQKKVSVGYTEAEVISKAFVEALEKKEMLRVIDAQSWVLMYPEFRKPSTKPAPSAPKPAAKPAAAAPTSQTAPEVAPVAEAKPGSVDPIAG